MSGIIPNMAFTRHQCGLDNIHMSWGHDEYLYQITAKITCRKPALYMIRYHSFYSQHREHEYDHLLNAARPGNV